MSTETSTQYNDPQTPREYAELNRRALRRLECEAHRYAEAMCNGVNHYAPYVGYVPAWDEVAQERYERRLMQRYIRLMSPWTHAGLFLNLDPRGYALKVREERAGDLPRDWGNYGLAAPDKL